MCSDLRHTTANQLMMAGVPIVAVAKRCRHKAPKLTMQVHGHLAPDYLRKEIDRFSLFPEPDRDADEQMAQPS